MAALLRDEELTRYYAIAGGDVLPVGAPPAARSHAWLEPVLAAQGQAELPTLELDVQGIHCAGCVWLIDELFRRRAGGASLIVNPALGKVRALLAARRLRRARASLDAVERFGYQLRPEPQARVAPRPPTCRCGSASARRWP